MPKQQQAAIKSAVNAILSTEAQFQFKISPKVISGIELVSNGYKLAWSISEYLNSLQQNISEMLDSNSVKEEAY